MGIADLFKKKESLIALDVGASALKLVELNTEGSKPRLISVASLPYRGNVFNNNMISDASEIADKMTSIMEANDVSDKRIATALPGPSVFTKKIKMGKAPISELSSNVQFEAANFIPHSIENVQLDFHIMGEASKNQLDVLVIAAKNDAVDNFINPFAIAGLEIAVLDVDYFAVQNCFELGYPELADKNIALINMGDRNSAVNLISGRQSMFTAYLSVGGSVFTEGLMSELGVSREEAEKLKRYRPGSEEYAKIADIFERKVDFVAGELNRELSLFWNASGLEEGIDYIFLTGGGSMITGLAEDLQDKTGVESQILDPLRGVEKGAVDAEYLEQVGGTLAVAVGLAIREPGDKIIPAY